ncbi:MAG: DUF1963 domain-containing protein, partial [Gemmatimonadetes bacterium]|nr:DUF1963 domain-containing protein [Gemmatimonadota bacterium]NIR78151.1 DUF1963 domain-containing protein [Gemmatimonadota bacterium]NIT86718.1 DUF1963 domain-containing protein [Gemmatimonadota bacterium]NIU30575.1 DUF1963 domain-containing protein [Gemmatimonadota bacterium]NIV60941.1 DUF1963 domain-containing protein [Gemmatimonadota bacterium]
MPEETEIRAALRAGPLAPRTEEIAALARPCVHLLTDPVTVSALSPATSRIGGVPDLPPGVEWPRWKGEPQSFIAQLDLADVAGLPGTRLLPGAGSLVFFYTARQDTWGFDPSDRGSWSVIHAPPGADLTRTEPPGPVPDGGRFRSCAVTFRSTQSLPAPLSKQIEGLNLGPEEE